MIYVVSNFTAIGLVFPKIIMIPIVQWHNYSYDSIISIISSETLLLAKAIVFLFWSSYSLAHVYLFGIHCKKSSYITHTQQHIYLFWYFKRCWNMQQQLCRLQHTALGDIFISSVRLFLIHKPGIIWDQCLFLVWNFFETCSFCSYKSTD